MAASLYSPKSTTTQPPIARGETSSGCDQQSTDERRPFEPDRIDESLRLIFSSEAGEQKRACEDVLALLNEAWSTPKVGRGLAYALCDRIRERKGIERMVALCTSSDVMVQLASIAALDQCLTPANRHLLVRLELNQFINIVRQCDSQPPRLVKAALGVIESLFKQSAATCNRLIDVGALDAVIYTCRSSDESIQRSCAATLANCAMYGTVQTQRNMAQRDAAEWLFRLAFSGNASIQYYACLAISVLASNKDIEDDIRSSGTLELIAPFVSSHDPGEFARGDKAHCQGRSADWLKRLIPVLEAGCKQAQCLAAFHFAMEADVKKEQNNLQVFQQIGAIQPLQNVALQGTSLSRRFAKSALLHMGHQLPKTLSLELLTWKTEDIDLWLKDIGLEQYTEAFKLSVMDGELLASLSDDDMQEELQITNRLHRRKLRREIVRLCSFADYGNQDTNGIGQWLCDVGREMARYRGAFIDSGVTQTMLPHLSDDDLRQTIGIQNTLHRKKLLLAVEQQFGVAAFSDVMATALTTQPQLESVDAEVATQHRQFAFARQTLASASSEATVTDGNTASASGVGHGIAGASTQPSGPLDIFISYRRSNGSQLASLLKVHLRLKLRNLNVFLDVDELGAGKFDEALLDHIAAAKNFILVLSPNSLDRCFGDVYVQDWVHKEVSKAVACNCNIIPVLDEKFEWPSVEKLPDDIKSITKFNGVAWSHMYQDAAIDKIIQFLQLDNPPPSIAAAAASVLVEHAKAPASRHAALPDVSRHRRSTCGASASPSALHYSPSVPNAATGPTSPRYVRRTVSVCSMPSRPGHAPVSMSLTPPPGVDGPGH